MAAYRGVVFILCILLGQSVIEEKSVEGFTELRSGNANALSIGAFNIQVFGRAKMGKPDVVEVLRQILVRYDLVLIQEIRDITEVAIFQLLDEVNDESPDDPYEIELSERLGRTSSKEQYAYFYRPSKLSVLDTYQYPESRDEFERPPFTVRFRARGHSIGDFAFMGIHVRPADAAEEINNLADVYDQVSAMWRLDDIIIGGDFNAGCRYLSSGAWEYIRLRTDSRFMWVIGDDADTTMAASACPYDRLVLAGAKLQAAYQPGSARPYRFEQDLNLSPQLASDTSDHVPVEMLAN